jgi:uncharacterized protein YgiM (DUF1202 family)
MLRIVSFLFVLVTAVSASANICIPGKGNLLKVVNVASDDTLNVRSGWTTDYDVLFELRPDQIGIFYNEVAYKSEECLSLCRRYLRGEDNLQDTIKLKCRNKSRIWYRITLATGDTGWASGKYLSEYQSENISISNGEQSVSKDAPALEIEEQRRAEEERLAREAEEKRRAEEERLAREAEEKRRAEEERLAREAEEKRRAEEERLAREAEEKRRAEEERLAREAEEKRRAEEERLAREAEEKRRAEEERLAREAEEKRLESIRSNYGFRDIKPGMRVDEVMKSKASCNLATGLHFEDSTTCYGLDNIKFISDAWAETSTINILGLDLGVLDSYDWASYIFADTDPESGNIYTSMRKNLDEKYSLEYEFTERDLDFFNNDERDVLRVVYEKGQITLQVERVKVDEYSKDIRLRLYYQTPAYGEKFYTKHKPKKASASDF